MENAGAAVGRREMTIRIALPALFLAAVAPALGQEAERLEIATELVARMASGQFDKATEPFDQTMKRALPANKLKEVWEDLIRQYGPLQRASETSTEKLQQYDVVYVTCEFQRGRLDAKVVFTQQDEVAGLFFVPAGRYKPPAYADASRFEEKQVRIGKGIWSLPGTLSLPAGDGPFPCVILVHGSGPHDRDESIGPNKPFRDLAHGLATRAVAVLRYEKRTKHHPILMALAAGSITVKEETVDDTAAAVEAAAGQEKIDPERIFVLGHSLGGMLLPRIAEAAPRAAGLISLAGSTRPLEDVVLEQSRYLASLAGGPSEDQQETIKEIEEQVARVKSPDLAADTRAAELPLGIPAKYWLDLRGYKPAEAAQKVSRPMLILQGERDYQVTMADFAGWKDALGSRKDVTFISYPRLNHLFMEGEGKSTPAEYMAAGNVAEVVVDDIAKWIEGLDRQTKGKVTEKDAPETAFAVTTGKRADEVRMKAGAGTAVFDVFSPSGIGGATITRTRGQWPAMVVLRLHLDGLESFSVSNGKVDLRGSVASHEGNARRLYLAEDGKAETPAPGTEIKVLDAAGRPVEGLPGKGGCFEIRLPEVLLRSNPKSLVLDWIDFYRG